MPSSFGTGLASGILEGWTKQSEHQDELKRSQKQKDIENNISIMNSRDVPDDVRSNAAQQLQDLMQGKKPGAKGGGQLSPVLQNLLKMIGKSHGDQGQSSQKPGGMTENMPNGQPAPGTAGSQPGALNTDPQTGRPSLQGTGNASADPANAPQPAAPGAQPPAQSGSTLDSQIDRWQRAVGSAKTQSARDTANTELNSLYKIKIQQEDTKAKIAGQDADQRREAKEAREDSLAAIKDAVKAGEITEEEGHQATAHLFGVQSGPQAEEKKVPGSALAGKTNPQTGQPYTDAFGNPIDSKQQYTFGKDKKFYPEGAGPDKMPTGELGQRIEANRIISDPNASADDKTAAKATIKHLDQVEKGVEVRVNAGGSSGAPMTLNKNEDKIATDLAYGKLTMSMLSRLVPYSRTPQDRAAKMEAIYNKASELNPNFNAAQFEMGFRLAANPKVQQQLASLDNVKTGVDDLLRASDAATRTGSTLLNKAVIPGGIAIGGKRYSNFDTARTAFADELSGALGFGSATDMSREMGFNMTDKNLSPENFRAAIQDIVIPFVDRKKQALLNQMGTYGQPGMNPAAGPGKGSGGPAPTTAAEYLKQLGQQ